VLLCEKPEKPETAELLTAKIKEYREQCPQIFPVEVKAGYGFKFAKVFSEVVAQLLKQREAKDGDLCITTYLDNDDALHQDFVTRVQKHAVDNKKTSFFLSFDYGLQFFTELKMATRILYSNNHFMSCSERVTTGQSPKTCYGYGSHFLLEEKGLAYVEHIHDKEHPMWIEVIHDKNVDNDVKMTLDTHIYKESLAETFGIQIGTDRSRMAFYRRYLAQMWRRTKEKFQPRRW